VSLDLSKSKEQDELKDWAELGPLEVRLCLTLRSPEEKGVQQASSEIAVAKGSTWQLEGIALKRPNKNDDKDTKAHADTCEKAEKTADC
jgi:hypothetical protein